MSFNTTIGSSSLTANLQGAITTTGGVNNPSLSMALQLINSAFTGGTGAGKCDQFYSTSLSIAASSSTDFDIYTGGGYTDIGGNAVTMAKLKILAVLFDGPATPNEADTITLGGKGSTAQLTSLFTGNSDSIILKSGAALILCNTGNTAWAVGNSTTNHILKIATGSNSAAVTVRLVGIGATA